MDPAKVAGVVEWPTPTQKKHVQAFLGFTNFYRKFIKDFSRIALPLNRLTGHMGWKWTENEQASFNAIKQAITSAPILTFPKDDGKYQVECDASLFALGAMLSQLQGGQWQTIAFLSKSFSPAEKHYDVYNQELLSVLTALEEWRHLLLGAREKFKIWNDHKNVSYFHKPQGLTPRQV